MNQSRTRSATRRAQAQLQQQQRNQQPPRYHDETNDHGGSGADSEGWVDEDEGEYYAEDFDLNVNVNEDVIAPAGGGRMTRSHAQASGANTVPLRRPASKTPPEYSYAYRTSSRSAALVGSGVGGASGRLSRRRALGTGASIAGPVSSSRRGSVSTATGSPARKGIVTPRRGRSPPPQSQPPPVPPIPQLQTAPLHPTEGVHPGAQIIRFTLSYIFSIFAKALSFLRIPLAVLLCLFLFAVVIQRISTTLHTAFSPLCRIPFARKLEMCSWDPHHPAYHSAPYADTRTVVPDFPSLISVQTKTFSQLLDESVKGNALSLEVKKAEMASKDLIVLVKHSELKAKDALAEHLGVFVESAGRVGKGLQRLDSKIGGAVDNIMAVNEYALQSIGSAQASLPSAWSPMALLRPTKQRHSRMVAETFTEAMNTLSVNMERLILEAEQRQMDLNKLEEDLSVVQDILTREDKSIVQEKDVQLRGDVLAVLWTALGGNNKKLRNFEENLRVLKDLGVYREQALAHVVGALQALRGMSADMEDLRERVAMRELVGETIPVEVHMRSIQMGIERLRDGRVRAKALEEDVVRKVMARHGIES